MNVHQTSGLLALRSKFANQKVVISSSGYDNSPIPEGVYTAEIVESEFRERETLEGDRAPVFYIRLRVASEGPAQGRSLFPFSPRLDELDGLKQAAQMLRLVLGDVLPGKTTPNGDFEINLSAFLTQFNKLAAECIGHMVEVRVKNSTKKKKDGTPRQNVFIQRALGRDKKGWEAKQKNEEASAPVKKVK
ncbi:MAG: hypothetical protein QXT73_01280 [Candidatus Methanomethylicaceae archaeon]